MIFAVSLSLRAASTFYVDSDWSGTQSGTASQPWKYLSSSSWSAINSALASGNVTVYFSAREAGSDTEDVYDNNGDGIQDGIELTYRSNTGAGVLTLDGRSFYNTSDASPNWVSYSGNSRNRVRNLNAQNGSHLKYSNITIRGFHVMTTDGNKIIAICGDNWLIEDCECEHTATASNGPGILLVPTSDSAHEGSSAYGPPCSNITIRNNRVHDTEGEAIYIGGGGIMDGTAGAGYPSHSNITIEGNIIYNAGARGGQGDAIDIKGGVRNVVVRSNEIYNLNLGSVRAIVAQGQMPGASQSTVIERNRIHDCSAIEDAAIAIVDSWGVPQGVVVRNNLIYRVNGAGIKIYDSQDTVGVYNNTISACGGVAIQTYAGASVINNLVFNNNGGGAQVSLSGSPVQCDYNAYAGSWGYSQAGSSSLNLSASQLSGAVVNAAAGDFSLVSGSPVIDKAMVLSGFANDFVNKPRGASWDIGAYEYSSGGSLPSNNPPIVNAGVNQTITLPVNSVAFVGTASDPNGTPVTVSWSRVSGPAPVTLSLPNSLTTTATFTTAGTYTLRLTASDGSLSASDDVVVTVNAQPVTGTDISFEAESGAISAPFVIANGTVSQASQTGIADGGRAVYNFSVAEAGSYSIKVLVNAPGEAANSLFLNIDADPEDPYMVWDIPITGGFEERQAAWRGNGTFDKNQFAPKIFNLTQGAHQLIIVGREPNLHMDRISILKLPPAPASLRIVQSP